MSAYVIFEVDIRDPAKYQEFMAAAKPALDKVGAKYLARGSKHRAHEGDGTPRRIVLLEFASLDACESFSGGATYRGLATVGDACASARLAGVEGLGT